MGLTSSKTMGQEPNTEFLWAREDYERLVEVGIFESRDGVELLNGKIINMAPQHTPHATAIRLVSKFLRSAFGDEELVVDSQLPIALDARSEPEPDLAVVRGEIRDFAQCHPSPEDVVLLVEVAEASIEKDRGEKLAAYARAGIAEYWIVDLNSNTLEVCRGPEGEDYTDRAVLKRGDKISPLGIEGEIAVEELLP